MFTVVIHRPPQTASHRKRHHRTLFFWEKPAGTRYQSMGIRRTGKILNVTSLTLWPCRSLSPFVGTLFFDIWHIFLHVRLGNALRAITAYIFSTYQFPKVRWTWSALYILTWKCASHHNRMHFFQHLNFQKWSEREMILCSCCSGFCCASGVLVFGPVCLPSSFLAFLLANVLRTTTACNFSSLIWPDGSAPAALASLLFNPPEPQIIGKTQWIATVLPFRAPASSFFFDLLTSLGRQAQPPQQNKPKEALHFLACLCYKTLQASNTWGKQILAGESFQPASNLKRMLLLANDTWMLASQERKLLLGTTGSWSVSCLQAGWHPEAKTAPVCPAREKHAPNASTKKIK